MTAAVAKYDINREQTKITLLVYSWIGCTLKKTPEKTYVPQVLLRTWYIIAETVRATGGLLMLAQQQQYHSSTCIRVVQQQQQNE